MSARSPRKLLIIEAAGLSHTFEDGRIPELWQIQSVFPALTCTVQASFRTALPPSGHGMIANGLFHRDLRKVMFWEQSSGLVAGERIWTEFRRRGHTVGMLFWQQSLGEELDLVLSPAPIHRHHGGMIEACYSEPPGLYEKLCKRVGRPFKLRHYWGPTACWKAGEWIADATAVLLADGELAPDLCLTYLPTLDYDLQRRCELAERGAFFSLMAVERQLAGMIAAAARHGYEVLVFGDYCIGPVSGAVLPNVALRDAGLMRTREVRGMLYPDLHAGGAFAMVDHQIAHVYVRDDSRLPAAKELLAKLPGVAEVLDKQAQAAAGLDHPNSGEIVIVAEQDRWFAYPWWASVWQGPEYARHVDIHNKPGFDPCELFFGWPPLSITQNTARVKGSHGRVGPGREVSWGATFSLPGEPKNIIELAACVREWLEQR